MSDLIKVDPKVCKFNVCKKPSTVYIGFYDQPLSQGSRSLNPIVVAKLSGFSLGLTTRWSLKPMQTTLRWVQRPPKVLTVAILLHKGRNWRSLYPRSLLCSTPGLTYKRSSYKRQYWIFGKYKRQNQLPSTGNFELRDITCLKTEDLLLLSSGVKENWHEVIKYLQSGYSWKIFGLL